MLIPAVRCIVHQTLTCKTVSPEVSELDLSSVLVWTFCFCLQVFCDETSIDNLSSGAPGMRLKLVFGSGSVFVLEICPQPGGEMVSKQPPSLCWLTKFLFVNTCQLTRNLQKKCQGFKLISTIDSASKSSIRRFVITEKAPTTVSQREIGSATQRS